MGSMSYRPLPRSGDKISVIGLGMGSVHESTDAEISQMIERALEAGVNFFDGVPSVWRPLEAYGHALQSVRSEVFLQIHLGAMYETGNERKYGWTLDLDTMKRTFEAEMKALRTDYADFGFVHCIDEDADLDHYLHDGPWDYLQSLKAAGNVRRLGASTHSPRIARRLVETGAIDMLMFSVNPAYDYAASSSDVSIGAVDERAELYRLCERAGVGISVMKAFAGGQLLDANTSPFKQALTKNQLIQYALDRPAVLTVLPGVRSLADVDEVLRFLDATPEERDYSVIGTFAPPEAQGACVYCNHCLPCPTGIDVGLVNKYYDLARAGDALAVEHYRQLSTSAADCLACGHCESRCPFGVAQEERMQEIATYFNYVEKHPNEREQYEADN